MIDKKIDELVTRLTEVYSPEKIYLFGSYAWGSPNADSDYDVLVEVQNSTERRDLRCRKGYANLFGFNKPVDLLVFTTEEIEERRHNQTSLIYTILEEGVVIYARA